MSNRPLLGVALALLAAAGYGFVPPLVRLAFLNGIPAWESAFFRTCLIVLSFSIAAVLLGMRISIPRGAWPGLLMQAGSTALVSLSYLGSVEFIPVGLAVIIFYTFPVIVLLAAPLVEGRALGTFRLAVALLAFAGLVLAVAPGFGALDPRGIALAATAAISATVQLFSGRVLSARMQPLAFGLICHSLIWPVMLLAALWASGGVLEFLPGGSANAIGWGALLGMGAVYVLTYFFHMQSLFHAPASLVAPFFNFEPVMTMAVAALLLGERLALNQYAGGSLVLVALVLAGLEERLARKPL